MAEIDTTTAWGRERTGNYDNGVPAFPRDHRFDGHNGMTVHQYYAGQALAGLCANPGGPFQGNDLNGWNIVNCTEVDVARLCLRLADAMLVQEGLAP